jgi:hypothetical protein
MNSKLPLIALVPIAFGACSSGESGPSGSGDKGGAYATGQLPTAAQVQRQTLLDTPAAEERPQAVSETVVGRTLDTGGSIPEGERTEEFAPGEEIHVAVRVEQPAPEARVRIVWFGPNNDLLEEEARLVSSDDEYVSFSIAGNKAADPGEYRAEVWVDDEKVDERRFAVVAEPRGNIGGG